MRTIHVIALILVIIGAVNWGLVGLAQFDLVATLLGGSDTPVARIVYSLVGLAGLALAATTVSHSTQSALHRSQAQVTRV